MVELKQVARVVAAPMAFLCLVAANAADADITGQNHRPQVAQIAQLHCRIYFGYAPLIRQAARSVDNQQE